MIPVSPLARLVLVTFLLSLAGACVAGSHWYAVDLPQQKSQDEFAQCTGRCISSNAVYMSPTGPTTPGDDSCQRACREQYLRP